MDSHNKKSTKKSRRSDTLFDTSVILQRIYRSMINDLRPFEPGWFQNPRKYSGPGYLYWKPYDYKVMCQLEHFFKRIVLPTDPSEEETRDKSLLAFYDSQKEFGIRRRTSRSAKVVQRAREIILGIIGEFDYVKFFSMCRFGKKAAVGLPYRESYLDVRADRLNGSKEQIEWFKAAMCYTQYMLHRAVRLPLKRAEIVETLTIQAVPKAFDKHRIIAPDTVIGGFLSTGLGRYLRQMLEVSTHIKLAQAQDKHKHLAQVSSVSGENATLDMKRASDSFVEEHLHMLLPESWHAVCDVVRIKRGEFKLSSNSTKVKVDLRSAMLMGSGHTFPLQTILFYSICKAVLELLGSRARVYVYGDDIILPAKYASYVIDILNDLGFTINEKKSFVDGPFRESCGGDYHHGIDVRPFMPEHVCTMYRAKEYTEFLHKLANGLLARWEYEEVTETYDTIIMEIVSIWGNVCPLPVDRPDSQGIKFIPDKFLAVAKRPHLMYYNGQAKFLVLMNRPKKRTPFGRIYLWQWLLGRQSDSCWTDDPLKWDADGNGLLDRHGQEPVKGSSKLCWITK